MSKGWQAERPVCVWLYCTPQHLNLNGAVRALTRARPHDHTVGWLGRSTASLAGGLESGHGPPQLHGPSCTSGRGACRALFAPPGVTSSIASGPRLWTRPSAIGWCSWRQFHPACDAACWAGGRCKLWLREAAPYIHVSHA
jgi:hypothetical protein